MIEFALVFGVILMVILAGLDIFRYLAIRIVLTKGAQNGLVEAETTRGLERDLRPLGIGVAAPPQCTNMGTLVAPLSCSGAGPACPAACQVACNDYFAYKCARERVIELATRFPLSTFVDDVDGSGAARLLPFRPTDEWADGAKSYSWTSNFSAAVLRPGEQVKQCNDAACTTSSVVCHPTFRPRSVGSTSASCSAPKIGTSSTAFWYDLTRNNPIVILMRVEMRTTIRWPWIPQPLILNMQALGYREMSRETKVPPELGIPVMPNSVTTTPGTTTFDPYATTSY